MRLVFLMGTVFQSFLKTQLMKSGTTCSQAGIDPNAGAIRLGISFNFDMSTLGLLIIGVVSLLAIIGDIV